MCKKDNYINCNLSCSLSSLLKTYVLVAFWDPTAMEFKYLPIRLSREYQRKKFGYCLTNAFSHVLDFGPWLSVYILYKYICHEMIFFFSRFSYINLKIHRNFLRDKNNNNRSIVLGRLWHHNLWEKVAIIHALSGWLSCFWKLTSWVTFLVFFWTR